MTHQLAGIITPAEHRPVWCTRCRKNTGSIVTYLVIDELRHKKHVVARHTFGRCTECLEPVTDP